MLVIALTIVSALGLLVLLLRPRERGPWVRNVTSTRNGQPWWVDRSLW